MLSRRSSPSARSRLAGLSQPEAASLRDGVLVFTRESCPNCSPVANYVMASGIKAVFVDVGRDEGLALARDLGVMATPTVLGLDGEGRESFRAFDVPGLRSGLEPAERTQPAERARRGPRVSAGRGLSGALGSPGLTRVAFIKTSLIDFPGRVASVLFLPGCDFRCPYCHNAALARRGAESEAGEDLRPLDEFYELPRQAQGRISGVVISGGEPLLHEEAPRIAAEIRGRGLAVKLDTNGSFPERIAEVGADYVALDLKTSAPEYGRVSPAGKEAGLRALDSLARLRSSGAPFEIRITCAPGIVGPAELEEMSEVFERGDEVVLQAFRPGACLDPDFDSVEPYSRQEMESLLAAARARAPKARLRGV